MDQAIRLKDKQLQVPPAQVNGIAHFSTCAVDEQSTVSGLLSMMGAEVDDVLMAATTPIPLRRRYAGASLFHEGARMEGIYFVRAGTFKIFRTAEDGYEQVLGFSGRTEVLGFDSIGMSHHPTAAIALEDSSAYMIRAQEIFTLGQRIPSFDRILHFAVSRALIRRGELADVMAAVAAEVRLARFLMQFSQRMEEFGQSPRRLHLHMSRRDIASYLGIAHETVSRSFTALASWGYIHVNNREVEILDMAGLKVFSQNTRRQAAHSNEHATPLWSSYDNTAPINKVTLS